MDFVQRNEKLKGVFANKQSMNMMYDFYKNLTSLYTEEYARVNGEEYNPEFDTCEIKKWLQTQ